MITESCLIIFKSRCFAGQTGVPKFLRLQCWAAPRGRGWGPMFQRRRGVSYFSFRVFKYLES